MKDEIEKMLTSNEAIEHPAFVAVMLGLAERLDRLEKAAKAKK